MIILNKKYKNEEYIMGLFKSKEEKAQEKRMIVKKSMKELERRIQKLSAQEQKYIESAKVAMREELPEQLSLAKQALKLTIAERKRTYKMLLNAEIISQMKDMTSMTGEFLGAVQVLSREIAQNTGINMTKIQNELNLAMGKMAAQTDNLEQMLEDSQDNIQDYSNDNDIVTDTEIDKLIYGGTSTVSTQDINSELEELKNRLK